MHPVCAQWLPFPGDAMAHLFVNRLTVIDFSYLHAERGLLGESWLVDVVLHGGLDEQGMVLDFGDVKKSVKQLIDERFDHKLLLPKRYAGLVQASQNDLLQLDFTTTDGSTIRHSSPADAVTQVDCEHITTDSLSRTIETALQEIMPPNVEAVEIHLSPETFEGAFYQYSHGLKQHCGNCQRIAHGHRSRLRIERNGTRDTALEHDWCELWRDIYIGSREDLVEEKDGQMIFTYDAEQGRFLLQLPAARCHLMDADSTVENIAQHIADSLKAHHPRDQLRVWAYEGVDKGAIGEA